mmetsp:Transcript_15759/g.54729  ORF Transcript_15759/g.54729 Transcript_15759/m.54729 type:complete len:242 (-) Transcript_15759:53-778(-)
MGNAAAAVKDAASRPGSATPSRPTSRERPGSKRARARFAATAPNARRAKGKKGDDDPELVFDAEQLEQLTMLSSYDEGEILRMFKRFRKATEGDDVMTEEDFREMPEIAVNPLLDRLVVYFGFKKPENEGCINFSMFVIGMSVFSHRGTKAKKMRASFDLYDVDGDGKISRDDLMHVLTKIIEFSGSAQEDAEKTLLKAVNRTFAEASGDEAKRFIMFDAWRQIVGQTDFDTKIMINLKGV